MVQARGGWLQAVEPALALGPAAPLRGAAHRSSDRIQGIWRLAEVAEGAEAEQVPRTLRRPPEALNSWARVVPALVLAVVVEVEVGARRRPWPRLAWGLRPARRRARSWSIPALPGGSAAR